MIKLNRREAMGAMGVGAAAMSAKAGASANETLSVGLIGCGGRMRGALMPSLKKIEGIRIDAVCDVYDDFLASAHVQAGGRDRDVMQTKDYRRVLERNDLDAVVIATPDHWHTPITIAACESGKHVYVEKPVTHKLEEGPQLLDAVERTGMKVQVGAQQRTMPHIVKLRERLKSGAVDPGPIHRVHMQWNRNHTPFSKWDPKINASQVDWQMFLGNAPDQPFDAHRMRNWRWIWDFGNGPLGDLMVHWLDATNWLLGLDMPARVTSMGGNYTTEGAWETPDTIHTLFQYPERDLQIDFVCTFANDHEHGSMRLFGEKASIYVDRARYEIHSQGNRFKDGGSEIEIASEGPPGQGDYADYDAAGLHFLDWMDAIKSDRQPVDNADAAVLPAAVCHYGNQAYREQRVVSIPG